MKVLIASWTWYPVGGDWTYIENLQKLYQSRGFEVVPFSTKNPKNIETPYEKFFVKGFDYKQLNKKKSLGNGMKALKNAVVSKEALENLDQLLKENEIAFAHLNIIHHWLTPAIVWKLKQHNIPILWSLHEYKIICPEGSFSNNGSVCEKCKNGRFYNCALNKCKKQSLLASLLASLDAYFYHYSGVYKKVDYFLCPSNFLLEKFEEYGFSKEKLVLSNLCYDVDLLDNRVDSLINEKSVVVSEKYILYVGRIEKTKGITTLLKAIVGTNVKLKVAGTGPVLEEMIAFVKDNNGSNIEFLGFCPKDVVYELTVNASFIVCPSEWYENFPYSVIETLLMSKPVIGANIGGIPELVVDGRTGLLFEPGNADELREKIVRLWNDETFALQLGHNGRLHAYTKVSFNNHWKRLEPVLMRIGVLKGHDVSAVSPVEPWQEEMIQSF